MTIFGIKIPIALSLLVWFALWEVVGRLDLSLMIPPVTSILMALWDLFGTAKFQAAIVFTVKGYAMGMALAIGVGVPLGALMGRIKAVDAVLNVWVNIFVSAPLTALVPVLMAVFGFGQITVVITVFLFAVWIIVLDTQAGVRQVDRSLLEMAHSFGASRVQLHARVIALAALPEILAGLRLGLIRGVKGVVIGQLLIAIIGIGELFELYSRNYLFKEFWGLIIVVFAFAFAVSEAVAVLERRVEHWASAR